MVDVVMEMLTWLPKMGKAAILVRLDILATQLFLMIDVESPEYLYTTWCSVTRVVQMMAHLALGSCAWYKGASHWPASLTNVFFRALRQTLCYGWRVHVRNTPSMHSFKRDGKGIIQILRVLSSSVLSHSISSASFNHVQRRYARAFVALQRDHNAGQ